MPYDSPGQAQAVFLAIKRRQGLAAAKKWAAKHKAELSGDAKGKKKGRTSAYMSRKARS